MEAGAGEGGDGAAVSPVEGEKATGLAGGGAGDGGFLHNRDPRRPVFGEEVGGAEAHDSAAAHYHPLRRRRLSSAAGRSR